MLYEYKIKCYIYITAVVIEHCIPVTEGSLHRPGMLLFFPSHFNSSGAIGVVEVRHVLNKTQALFRIPVFYKTYFLHIIFYELC